MNSTECPHPENATGAVAISKKDLRCALNLVMQDSKMEWSGDLHLLTGASDELRVVIPPVTGHAVTLDGLISHTAFSLWHAPAHGHTDALDMPFYQAVTNRKDWHGEKSPRWSIFQEEMVRWLDAQEKSRTFRPPGMEATGYAWFFQEIIQAGWLTVSERTHEFINAHDRINRKLAWWCPVGNCIVAIAADTPPERLSQITVLVKVDSERAFKRGQICGLCEHWTRNWGPSDFTPPPQQYVDGHAGWSPAFVAWIIRKYYGRCGRRNRATTEVFGCWHHMFSDQELWRAPHLALHCPKDRER